MSGDRVWYLSLADKVFLGACLVRASSLRDAMAEAHLFECNPGGEVVGVELTDEDYAKLESLGLYRLISRAELELLGPTIQPFK